MSAYVQRVSSDSEALPAVEDAISAVAEPINTNGIPSAMQPIRAHLRVATERAQGRTDESAATLLTNHAFYLQMIGDLAGAQHDYERALAINEQALEPEHKQTLMVVGNIAIMYYQQQRYADALPLFERVEAAYTRTQGPEAHDTVVIQKFLAATRQALQAGPSLADRVLNFLGVQR